KTRAEDGLGQVEGHLTYDIESLAVKEPVGLHLERDQKIARRRACLRRSTLASHADARPGLGSGRDRNVHLALGPHLAGAVAGGARLGRDAAPASALGARTVHREAALAERDGPPALAFRTGRPGGARRAARAGAGGTGLGDLQGNGDLSPQRRD